MGTRATIPYLISGSWRDSVLSASLSLSLSLSRPSVAFNLFHLPFLNKRSFLQSPGFRRLSLFVGRPRSFAEQTFAVCLAFRETKWTRGTFTNMRVENSRADWLVRVFLLIYQKFGCSVRRQRVLVDYRRLWTFAIWCPKMYKVFRVQQIIYHRKEISSLINFFNIRESCKRVIVHLLLDNMVTLIV